MEKSYVFCGCQIYPSATAVAGSSAKKSCWEWDIPTPKPKTKRISQSNPILPTPKRFDMDSINKRYSDNLYEPVNPPPLYGSGYMNKEHDTASLDERMIDIPPELDIINSEGLDGLDLPDHDLGVDGDREWHSFHHDRHDSSSQRSSQKGVFTAGIRNRELPKYGETSSARPLANKTLSFSPDVPPPEDEEFEVQQQQAPIIPDEIPSSSATEPAAVAAAIAVEEEAAQIATETNAGGSKPSALEQLKSRAGQMKQRLSKISLPVRPKFNQWTGIKLSKKGKEKKKNGKSQDEFEDQQVPEDVGGWTEPLSLVPETERPHRVPTQSSSKSSAGLPSLSDIDREFFQGSNAANLVSEEEEREDMQQQDLKVTAAIGDRSTKSGGEEDDEEKRRKVEEKLQKDEELKRLRAEEKLQKEKEQEELKRLKEEEKLRKEKEQLAVKRAKEDEKARKIEEQKRLKEEYKIQKDKEREELRLKKEAMAKAKEDKLRKAKEKAALAEEAKLQQQQQPDNDDAASEQPIEEEMMKQQEQELPSTPSTSKKQPKTPETEKKRKLIDIDFTKRFKRSKTPPPRPEPPKLKFSRGKASRGGGDSTQNQLAEQYAREIESRDIEMEQESSGGGLREPQIFITQPSVESSDTTSDTQQRGISSNKNQRLDRDEGPVDEECEEEEEEEQISTPAMTKQQQNKEKLDKIHRKFKGFGVKSKAIAAQTSKNLGQTMKAVGHGIKEFGVNAVQEVKAKQEALRQKEAQRKAEQAEDLGDAYVPSQSAEESRVTFKFKKQDRQQQPGTSTSSTEVGEGGMILEEQISQVRPPPPSPSPARSPREAAPVPPRVVGMARSFSASEASPEARKSQRSKEADDDDKFVHRSQLLGRADRDWESPIDLVESRDASEEPFSGNASSRDSPPGSSMASSSIMHQSGRGGGRQGVLEEIDSDEFFLRERGISEGEDEEEVNRFLVEELRQAFRPMVSNALTGFDLPSPSSPPSRPGRSPRKPPRKEKASVSSNNFQTFPPERPKRKHTPGYISSYINANVDHEEEQFQGEEEEGDEEESQNENRRKTVSEGGEAISFNDEEEGEQEEEEDEVLRRVKEELRKIDQDLEEEEDDGRYEPVNDSDQQQQKLQQQQEQPIKPQRSKRKKMPPTPQAFYYNTIAANEWMRDVENEIQTNNDIDLTLVDDTQQQQTPSAPKRVKSKSGSSSLAAGMDDSEIHFADDDIDNDETIQASPRDHQGPPLAQAESEGRLHSDEFIDLDDVDESGYAVVHKVDSNRDLPTTFPRKKKKKTGGVSSKGNSLKRRSQEGRPLPPGSNNNNSISTATNGGSSSNNTMFFSLPRHTPRTFHIVPPTRPHRTYSTLHPKRPPRTKSKSAKNLAICQATTSSPTPSSPNLRNARPTTPASPGSRRDEDRPSTAIGIMQGRPLPPPPRPPERLNDLDQASIERLVNMRHYVNFDNDEEPETDAIAEVREEPFTVKNIPLLTQRDGGGGDDASGGGGRNNMRDVDSVLANSDINVAVQTDPIHDEDYELNIAVESFEEDDERIEQKMQRSSASHLPSYEQEHHQEEEQIPPPIPERPIHRTQPQQQLPQQQSITAPAPAPPSPQIVFPTRLHLDELEVDVLRVNDLTANILSLDQLRAPHLELNSLSTSAIVSRGQLSVSSIRSPNLSVEQLDCQRCDVPIDQLGSSIPPPSFYNLASPPSQQQPQPQQQQQQQRKQSSGQYVEDDENCCESHDCQEEGHDENSCPCPNIRESESIEEQNANNSVTTPSSPPVESSSSPRDATRISSVPTGISRTSSADPDLEDIAHLSMRLGRAILRVTVRSLHAMAEYVEMAASNDPDCQEQQRGNMQVLLCLLLVLVAGVILVGRSASVEPRWQYFLPPGDM